MTDSDYLALAAFALANVAAASSGAICRPGQWYADLVKPRWCPPDRLFGPAWLVLYTMITLAGWRVWRAGGLEGDAGVALGVYGVHLVLNCAWSVLFFGLRRPDLAFIELVLFWVSIAATIFLFHAIDPIAAYLLVPYLVWVTFAGALNLSLWQLNKVVLSRVRAHK